MFEINLVTVFSFMQQSYYESLNWKSSSDRQDSFVTPTRTRRGHGGTASTAKNSTAALASTAVSSHGPRGGSFSDQISHFDQVGTFSLRTSDF